MPLADEEAPGAELELLLHQLELALGEPETTHVVIQARVRIPITLSAIQAGEITRNLYLAGKMMAIIAVATLLHKAPDFVYKAF